MTRYNLTKNAFWSTIFGKLPVENAFATYSLRILHARFELVIHKQLTCDIYNKAIAFKHAHTHNRTSDQFIDSPIKQ